MIGAVLLEHVGQGVLTTPAIVVAVTLKAFDGQACENLKESANNFHYLYKTF
jgi:hypothetical protein